MLMSAFILPGLGQFVNKQILKGIIVMVGSIGTLLWLIIHVFSYLAKTFSLIFDTMSDGGSPADLAPSICIPLVIGLLLAFMFFYFYGLVDSYIVARRNWNNRNIY